MKILIYGWKGWIGSQFVSLCTKENVDIVLGESRLDDESTLTDEIDDVSPTHVVAMTGRTHGVIGDKTYNTIDYLEQPGKLVENMRDNLYAPMLLAMLSQSRGFHFTYLGTGCIFKYDSDHPYGNTDTGFMESDKPNFFGSSYSIVKGFTDRLMHQIGGSVLNVRIRMPITGDMNPRNFITKIVNYEKVCSVPNSMTVLPELLPILLDMIRKEHNGTVNLCNPGVITHNEILEMYRTYVDPSKKWANFTEEEQREILAADRSNNCMDTTFLELEYPHVRHIRDAVKDAVLSIAKNEKTGVYFDTHEKMDYII